MSSEQSGRDLKQQINELWKTTIDQFDEIKDVIVRHSHLGRKRLDTAFLRRQRDRLLQDLGESVFQQVEAGILELAPDGIRLVERIHEVLEQIKTEEVEMSRLTNAAAPVESGIDADESISSAAPYVDALDDSENDNMDGDDDIPLGVEAAVDARAAAAIEIMAHEKQLEAEKTKKMSKIAEEAVDAAPENEHKNQPDAERKPRRRSRRGRKPSGLVDAEDEAE